MVRRVLRAATRIAVAGTDAARLEAALREAIAARRARLGDDEHPDVLHPARTAIILMDDVGVRDVDVLVAGVLCESRSPEMAVAETRIPVLGGTRAHALWREVPAGDDELLAERLLDASDAALLIALAERLDHARHLHLRSPSKWAAEHERTCAVYAPMAARSRAVLGRRYRWWCNTFARRFLGR